MSSLKGINGIDGKTVELRVYNNELQYRWLDSAGHDVSMWTHLFLLTDLNGKSAYEVAVENGFTGSEKEWLQSITPDLSPYITRVEVLKIVDDKVHSSSPDLSPYVTRVEAQKLVEAKFQTVENDLTSLENTVNSEIQTVKDSVEPVVSQAHWHHNLTLLNSLTSAKIAKWDKISDIDIELQQLRDSTQYDQQNQNDAILNLENRITILESQISSGNNTITLFSAGSDALKTYGESIYTFYNDGYRSLSGFAETYPNFCSAENNHAIYYNQPDFNWGATIYTLCTEPVLITSSKSILFRYTSGAADVGEMWLVPKSNTEISAAETARYIHESIVSGTAVPVPFSWLQSPDNDSTVLLSCESVTTGDYYLAWKAVTDNTHPKIKLIKVLEG